MKLDLDASMAPEMEVTSTVASGNSNNSSDSDQSNEMPTIASVSTVNVNSSGTNIHPTIENQFKVSQTFNNSIDVDILTSLKCVFCLP